MRSSRRCGRRQRNHRRHPEVLASWASLEGCATSVGGLSFETPRKSAAPQDDGGVYSEPKLHLLHPAPLRDEQRGGLGGFAQRIEIDIFIKTVHRRPAGAETQARNVVVQSVKARVGECREYQI